MRCGDPRRWLENIITPQLWSTNYLRLLPFIPSLQLVTFGCISSCAAVEQGVILVEKSVLPIRPPPLLNFSFDQVDGPLMGAKIPNRSPRLVQTLKYLSDCEMICYANHYSYLTTCGVATSVLMGPSRWKAFIDVDSHTFQILSHHTMQGTWLVNQHWVESRGILGCVTGFCEHV